MVTPHLTASFIISNCFYTVNIKIVQYSTFMILYCTIMRNSICCDTAVSNGKPAFALYRHAH